MGKIFCLMGKSSTGKDTLYKMLLEDGALSLKKIIPYTTRPMRRGETDGVEYYFCGEKELADLLKRGKVIELRAYDTVQGVWKYFTVDDHQIQDLRQNYLLIGTLEAYGKLRDYFGKERIVPIYIEVEDGIRLERAIGRERQQREPHYEEMCRRFLADEKDFSKERLAACGIDRGYENNDFNTCIQLILKDIEAKGDK
jgi:guanylate kinase